MVLEFREYKKKIKKDTILELDLQVDTGEILTIINNKSENLELLKDSFRKRSIKVRFFSMMKMLVSKNFYLLKISDFITI